MQQPHRSTTEMLFLKWQEGDLGAYDVLFLKFYPVFCHYSTTFGLAQEDAEEVVQDCFYKLWEKRDSLSDILNFKAYLYTSVKNASLNRLKMLERLRHRDHHYYEGLAAHENPIDFALIEAEILSYLREAIQSLPEQCAKVMHLSYEKGFSGKEISDALGITVSTVNNQKARGVKLLRGKLAGRDSDVWLSIILLHLTTL